MKQLSYEEYSRYVEVLNADYWVDGEPQALITYPLYVEIEAGETISLDFNQSLTAPSEPGLYELWHVVLGGRHSHWEWRPA